MAELRPISTTLLPVISKLRAVLETEPGIAYAVLFGSRARGTAHGGSDADVGIGLVRGTRLSARDVGGLVARLEAAAGGRVDLALLDEAGPALAYRVFRDGQVILERDHAALVARKARAILEYLDFKPVEDIFTRRVLEAARRG